MDKYSTEQLRRIHRILKKGAVSEPEPRKEGEIGGENWVRVAGKMQAHMEQAIEILEEYFGIKNS